MTDASELVDLAQAELPDIPFNHASLEGRELEYIQEAVAQRPRRPPAARSRSVRRPCSPSRRARKRCC